MEFLLKKEVRRNEVRLYRNTKPVDSVDLLAGTAGASYSDRGEGIKSGPVPESGRPQTQKSGQDAHHAHRRVRGRVVGKRDKWEERCG